MLRSNLRILKVGPFSLGVFAGRCAICVICEVHVPTGTRQSNPRRFNDNFTEIASQDTYNDTVTRNDKKIKQ